MIIVEKIIKQGDKSPYSIIDYLFITYMVISKPNLASTADGFVHIMISFLNKFCYKYNYTLADKIEGQRRISLW